MGFAREASPMTADVLRLAAALLLLAGVVLLAERMRSESMTPGKVVPAAMVGGPMDGTTVLARIGGLYWNPELTPTGWIYHRYLISPGGWGIYTGVQRPDPLG